VPVDPGVSPLSKVFLPFSNRWGQKYLEWPVVPHIWLFLWKNSSRFFPFQRGSTPPQRPILVFSI
jgi:hypothetical protein